MRAHPGHRLLPVPLKKEVPGFVENRVLYAIMRECLALVDEGVVDAEELDLNVKWGIGYKLAVIRPMHLLDMAGMDIYTAVGSLPQPRPVQRDEVSPTIGEPRRAGPAGHEDRGGLFDYTAEQVDQLRAAAGRRAGRGAQGARRHRRRRRMKIWLLDCGSLVIDQSHVTVAHRRRHAGPLPRLRRLIEHPEGCSSSTPATTWTTSKAVLPFELPEQTPEQTIPAQLAQCGFKPEDVDYVVNSHFHFDHVGGNRYLTNATRARPRSASCAQARAASRSSASATPTGPGTHERASWSSRGRHGDRQGAAPVRDARPHRRATIRCWRSRRAPAMIFPCDAVYTRDATSEASQAGFHLDPSPASAPSSRIRALAEEHDAEIFPSHDMDAWRHLQVTPPTSTSARSDG